MKTLKNLLNSITSVIVTVVVAAAVLLAGVRAVGLTPCAVIGAEMEPTYPEWSIVYVKKAETQSLSIGDAVTYIPGDGEAAVTRRIADIDDENSCIYTKGDANDAEDAAPVPYENIIGTPELCVPYIGRLLVKITNPPELYIACAAAVTAVVISFLPDLLIKDKKKKGNANEDNTA